jgi:hypothetical protein
VNTRPAFEKLEGRALCAAGEKRGCCSEAYALHETVCLIEDRFKCGLKQAVESKNEERLPCARTGRERI